MSDHVTLVGAEDVRSAGRSMLNAADQMQTAASNITFALEQHQRFLDDWLGRLADVLAAPIPVQGTAKESDHVAK